MNEKELQRLLLLQRSSASSDNNDVLGTNNSSITIDDVLVCNLSTDHSISSILPVTIVQEGKGNDDDDDDNEKHVPGYDTSSEEEDYTSDDDDLVVATEKKSMTTITTTTTTKSAFRDNKNNNNNNNDDDDLVLSLKHKQHQFIYSKTTCNSSSGSSTDEDEDKDDDDDDDDDDVVTINENSAKELFPNDNDAQTRIQEAKELLLVSSSSLSSSPLKTVVTTTTTSSTTTTTKKVDDYISRRIMTSTQERWNGLTILPSTIFCLWYCYSGAWWKWNYQRLFLQQDVSTTTAVYCLLPTGDVNDSYMLPPLPMLSIVIGIVLHAPFSFIHHYYYCVILPPGQDRFNHWSRQYDQGFIHIASAFISYGTSGNIKYFLCNLIFSIYCFYKLLIAKKATPIPNQLRILISMILYTCPVLFVQNNVTLFIQVWFILLISIYIFATYPMKGWSHCAFHLVIAFVPPMLMYSSTNLSQCKDIILRAAAAASSTSEQQCLELL